MHSYLNYGILIWGAAFNSYLLITQQNKAFKILARVTGNYYSVFIKIKEISSNKQNI